MDSLQIPFIIFHPIGDPFKFPLAGCGVSNAQFQRQLDDIIWKLHRDAKTYLGNSATN
jgi:hypothetical protein